MRHENYMAALTRRITRQLLSAIADATARRSIDTSLPHLRRVKNAQINTHELVNARKLLHTRGIPTECPMLWRYYFLPSDSSLRDENKIPPKCYKKILQSFNPKNPSSDNFAAMPRCTTNVQNRVKSSRCFARFLLKLLQNKALQMLI